MNMNLIKRNKNLTHVLENRAANNFLFTYSDEQQQPRIRTGYKLRLRSFRLKTGEKGVHLGGAISVGGA